MTFECNKTVRAELVEAQVACLIVDLRSPSVRQAQDERKEKMHPALVET